MEGVSIVESVLVGIFVVLMILQLRDFISLLPYLFDSLFRARGSVALDSSVPVSRIRNNIALTLIIPVALLIYRYGLWAPSFLEEWSPSLQLLTVAGAFFVYLLLRFFLYASMKPRRRYDFYQISHRSVYTYFIIFCIFLFLPTYGILTVFNVPEALSRDILLAESAFFYLVLLLRRAQILSLSCNHLRTFLYLCGLEILPTAIWVVSAIVF